MVNKVNFSLEKRKDFLTENWNTILIILIIIKIILLAGLPINNNGDSPHDNMLFVNYANSISQYNWLGDYNVYTLIKGPIYSIFLAVCNIFNIPYLWGLGILYSFSVLSFIKVLEKLIPDKRILVVIFIYILYTPVMFSTRDACRIYRAAIIPAAVIFVFSAIISMYESRFEKMKIFLTKMMVH